MGHPLDRLKVPVADPTPDALGAQPTQYLRGLDARIGASKPPRPPPAPLPHHRPHPVHPGLARRLERLAGPPPATTSYLPTRLGTATGRT